MAQVDQRHAVNTRGVAILVGMPAQRIRRYIHEKVIDEDRFGDGRNSPFMFWESHIGQLLITQEMRALKIGLNTIRAVIDDYDQGVDDFTIHWDYVFITINMKAVKRKAKVLMQAVTRSDKTFREWQGGQLVALS